MEELEVLYRSHYKGLPPQKIKLKIPGWAGDSYEHGDWATPQPWHCPPFVDGSTYGIELLYSYNSCTVYNRKGKLEFEGDFSNERNDVGIKWPPFQCFAPNHYGMTSSLDIKVPEGYLIRLESHPCYYTDTSYTTPCVVPGHIQSDFWPRIFFVVFKAPPEGHYHVFKRYKPYAQILVLPKKMKYEIIPMDSQERQLRATLDEYIRKYAENIAENIWHDNTGHPFDDKYKVLGRIFKKSGKEGLIKYLESFKE